MSERDDYLAAVDAAFAPGGALAQALPGFAPRAAQTDMAATLAATLADGERCMVEAGTGVGKSFAYLVPALLHGGKVLISTATKTLQDQLFLKDIPAVRAALGVPVDVALLKGRSNYVCRHRLRQAQTEARFASRDAAQHLRRVIWLAQSSSSGDRAELPDVPDDSSVWPWVTSTRDNCLGADCPDFGDCFVVKARRRALAADVVVINHHLFFADLMLRDTGGGELLPVADAVVFDEAHQLLDIGLNFAGLQLSTQQWVELARDLQAAGLTHARGLADWVGLAASLQQAVREARLAAGHRTGRFGWDSLPHAATAQALAQLRASLAPLADALAQMSELAPEFARLQARVAELDRCIARLDEDDGFALRMVEITPHAVRWRASPLNLRDSLGAFVAQSPAAFVFTSATMSTRGDFSYLADALGVRPDRALALPSPFDFARQARLYVPQRFPLPRDAEFESALVDEAVQLVRASPGGALLLCTSLRSMRALGEQLTARLGRELPVIVQEQTSRREALDRMRARRSLLVGSQSFWEGLDLPGELLTLVMIDKLPFAPPDDPLAKARSDEAERDGRSGFNTVALPQAAMALKQGAGRLIRTLDDRGVLAVFDRRLAATGYGRSLLAALPPFARVARLEQACAFLRGEAAPAAAEAAEDSYTR